MSRGFDRKTVTVSGSTAVVNSSVITFNPYGDFRATCAVNFLSSASAPTTLKFTLDDVYAPNFSAASARWYQHPYLKNLVATSVDNIFFPVTGVRLSVSTSSTASYQLVVVQTTGR